MDHTKWWEDWQNPAHAREFDFRAWAPNRILIRDLESFNDVRLLNEALLASPRKHLCEIGCATGDFYRYLLLRHPEVKYNGTDVSKPAIERARSKYPSGHFEPVDPAWDRETMVGICGGARPGIVFSKDVVHHQVKPLEFLSCLLQLPSEMLILRTRTRDHGPTEWDPDKSCQYHYSGWMPYIVMNLSEMIEHIQGLLPASEIIAYRNHIILGGKHNRYLPKDCYLEQTGTAETALGVFLITKNPGKVTIKDRPDSSPHYSSFEMAILGARKLARIVRSLELIGATLWLASDVATTAMTL